MMNALLVVFASANPSNEFADIRDGRVRGERIGAPYQARHKHIEARRNV